MRQNLTTLLSHRRALLLCGLFSASLLIVAFLFEHVGGMAPCKLCIWQRWAHVAIILLALSGLVLLPPKRLEPGLVLVVLGAACSAGLGGYHAGVEWQLWEGPSGCTASLGGGLNASLLVDQLLDTPVVRCDEVPWSLFGLSMAGWNALLSLDIMIIALMSVMAGRHASQ